MSKTTLAFHLYTNLFLVPAQPDDLRRRQTWNASDASVFWDYFNDGAGAFFHLIAIPVDNIGSIAVGYGGEFYDLTAADLRGRQFATIEHPLTGKTSRAVLHVAREVDPRSRGIIVHGRDTSFIVNLQTRVGARAPILYQFQYFARDQANAVLEFLEDQPDLLTLPGAV